MPGLKGMIRTIGRCEFREFIEKNAPSIAGKLDWNADGDKYVDGTFDVLTDNKKTPHEIREQFFPHLYEIHLLSENPKEGLNYRKNIFDNKAARQKWLEHFALNAPDIG